MSAHIDKLFCLGCTSDFIDANAWRLGNKQVYSMNKYKTFLCGHCQKMLCLLNPHRLGKIISGKTAEKLRSKMPRWNAVILMMEGKEPDYIDPLYSRLQL